VGGFALYINYRNDRVGFCNGVQYSIVFLARVAQAAVCFARCPMKDEFRNGRSQICEMSTAKIVQAIYHRQGGSSVLRNKRKQVSVTGMAPRTPWYSDGPSIG